MKPKVCPNPECGKTFFRRSKGNCPHCGYPIALRGGKAVSMREIGNTVAVFEHFLDVANSRKGASPIYFGPKGSKPYITQLAFARQLIADAGKYLGYSQRYDLDTTEFAKLCIDKLFDDPGWRQYATKVNSLKMCNGNAFWSLAPKVLDDLNRQAIEEARQQLHIRNLNNDVEVMALG